MEPQSVTSSSGNNAVRVPSKRRCLISAHAGELAVRTSQVVSLSTSPEAFVFYGSQTKLYFFLAHNVDRVGVHPNWDLNGEQCVGGIQRHSSGNATSGLQTITVAHLKADLYESMKDLLHQNESQLLI